MPLVRQIALNMSPRGNPGKLYGYSDFYGSFLLNLTLDDAIYKLPATMPSLDPNVWRTLSASFPADSQAVLPPHSTTSVPLSHNHDLSSFGCNLDTEIPDASDFESDRGVMAASSNPPLPSIWNGAFLLWAENLGGSTQPGSEDKHGLDPHNNDQTLGLFGSELDRITDVPDVSGMQGAPGCEVAASLDSMESFDFPVWDPPAASTTDHMLSLEWLLGNTVVDTAPRNSLTDMVDWTQMDLARTADPDPTADTATAVEDLFSNPALWSWT